MQIPHVRNGLFLGLSCIAITLVLYFIGIESMLAFRGIIIFGLYIYWMRRALKETIALGGTLDNSALFRAPWLTFVLGVTISLTFYYLFANYGDPSIISTTLEVASNVQGQMASLFNLSEDQIADIEQQAAFRNPYGLAAFAANLPGYFVVPGAIIAFIMSRFIKPAPVSMPNDSQE